MRYPTASILGACILSGLIACDQTTWPAEPSAPSDAVAGVTQQFTIRNLGTLGGGGRIVGFRVTTGGGLRAALWTPATP